MAASIQRVTEEILLKMITHLHEITGLKKLCLAGGVALNSVANYKLMRQGPFADVYIHPAPGDDECSAGAASGPTATSWTNRAGRPWSMGSEHGDESVQTFLEANDIPYRKIADDEEFFDFVARTLEAGHVCGWMRGRCEWGPRALGSRSIIADPGAWR